MYCHKLRSYVFNVSSKALHFPNLPPLTIFYSTCISLDHCWPPQYVLPLLTTKFYPDQLIFALYCAPLSFSLQVPDIYSLRKND